MRLYRVLAAILPRSYVSKMVAVALAATGLPFLVAAANLMIGGHLLSGWRELTAIALATLVGMLLTTAALRALLAPLLAVRDTLESYSARQDYVALPRGYRDEAGRLMELTDRMITTMRDELSLSRTAADTDPLTGLLNRRGFDRHRPANRPGSIVFVDLDRFKRVNDTLGHDAGDLVLIAMAELLQSVLREGELVARFGGEEFVVFLPEVGEAKAALVAERIRRTAEQRLSTALGPVTISAGVAHMAPGTAFSDALAEADRAVYVAKHRGRNRVCRAEPASAPPAPAGRELAWAATAAE